MLTLSVLLSGCFGTVITTENQTNSSSQQIGETVEPEVSTNPALPKLTHYTKEDILKIRNLAKKCKFDLDPCIKDYVVKINDEVELVVITPYIEAISKAAGSEKNYEEYTDEQIIEVLNQNSVKLVSFQSPMYALSKDNIGKISNLVVSLDGQVYPSEYYSSGSTFGTLGSSGVIRRQVEGYFNFSGKKATVIFIAKKGELKEQVDFSQFK